MAPWLLFWIGVLRVSNIHKLSKMTYFRKSTSVFLRYFCKSNKSLFNLYKSGLKALHITNACNSGLCAAEILVSAPSKFSFFPQCLSNVIKEEWCNFKINNYDNIDFPAYTIITWLWCMFEDIIVHIPVFCCEFS